MKLLSLLAFFLMIPLEGTGAGCGVQARACEPGELHVVAILIVVVERFKLGLIVQLGGIGPREAWQPFGS